MNFSGNTACRAVAAALGLSLALGIASTAEAGQGRFTFRGIEFMPSDDRIPAAQTFLARQLPTGLPIAEAIRRLKKADANCAAHPGANAGFKCQWSMLEHPTGHDLGEVTWTVNFTQDGQGRLASATVERSTTT